MPKTKKEVPAIVKQFWEMDEDRQLAAINIGSYDDHLEILRCHSQMGTVLTYINRRIRELAKINVKTTDVAVMEPKVHPVNICPDLNQAAHLINHRYEIITQPARAASRAVIEIGIIMLAVKDVLPHGKLEEWRENNTNVSKTWDHYCRKAAQQFIDRNGMEMAGLLCDPSRAKNPEEAVIAEQMLMDFTGGKGPAALLNDLGIKKQDAGNLNLPKQKPLDPGETQAHRTATELIYPLMAQLHKCLISDERMVQHLDMKELKVLQGDLIDAKRIVDGLIKAG